MVLANPKHKKMTKRNELGLDNSAQIKCHSTNMYTHMHAHKHTKPYGHIQCIHTIYGSGQFYTRSVSTPDPPSLLSRLFAQAHTHTLTHALTHTQCEHT